MITGDDRVALTAFSTMVKQNQEISPDLKDMIVNLVNKCIETGHECDKQLKETFYYRIKMEEAQHLLKFYQSRWYITLGVKIDIFLTKVRIRIKRLLQAVGLMEKSKYGPR